MKQGQYRQMFDLTGRVAVVTGGVGILGRRFCAALADHGASVAVVDIDEGEACSFARELSQIYAVKCSGHGVDIADPDAIAPMADAVESAIGPITILHNNAATKGDDLEKLFAATEDYTPETWRQIMSVNLDGAFYVAKEVGGRMAANGKGSIIQTSSIYGVMAPDQRIYEGSDYMGGPINTPAVYSASKAGIVGLTKYLSTYWAAKGVRVNTLTPGGVSSGQNSEFHDRYSARIPLGRMANADEITGALVFLASDASSYITGQNIIVDGGLNAW